METEGQRCRDTRQRGKKKGGRVPEGEKLGHAEYKSDRQKGKDRWTNGHEHKSAGRNADSETGLKAFKTDSQQDQNIFFHAIEQNPAETSFMQHPVPTTEKKDSELYTRFCLYSPSFD